jgi:hypothetical protein
MFYVYKLYNRWKDAPGLLRGTINDLQLNIILANRNDVECYWADNEQLVMISLWENHNHTHYVCSKEPFPDHTNMQWVYFTEEGNIISITKKDGTIQHIKVKKR